MTQSIILAENTGSKTNESHDGLLLHAATRKHLASERASFHTPGHKGRLSLDIGESAFAGDLTELPGLDQLSSPTSVLHSLQEQIASAFGSRRSFISVNGASAALTASILACSAIAGKILLPRNVHRSALNALVMSGLGPVWYEPDWLSDWNSWGAVNIESFKKILLETKDQLAAAIVCSPNYAGANSNIKEIATLCKGAGVILIVDEAHGAHVLPGSAYSDSALESTADLVVHSMHKTLTAPTQTGLLHIGKNCPIADEQVLASLNLLQSSSPSYLFLLGIERALSDLRGAMPDKAYKLSGRMKSRLASIPSIKMLQLESGTDPLHVLIRHKNMSAARMNEVLLQKGIFAETVLGNGLLLLLGLATSDADIEAALCAIADLDLQEGSPEDSGNKPVAARQILNPRQAFFAESITVKSQEAAGKISCDWIAPCPPGYAIVAPGQEISQDSLKFIGNHTSIRVVKSYLPLEGDSDGPDPNTTS